MAGIEPLLDLISPVVGAQEVLYIEGIRGEQFAVIVPLPAVLGGHAQCDEVIMGGRKFFA